MGDSPWPIHLAKGTELQRAHVTRIVILWVLIASDAQWMSMGNNKDASLSCLLDCQSDPLPTNNGKKTPHPPKKRKGQGGLPWLSRGSTPPLAAPFFPALQPRALIASLLRAARSLRVLPLSHESARPSCAHARPPAAFTAREMRTMSSTRLGRRRRKTT